MSGGDELYPPYGHQSSQLKCMNVFPFTPDTLTDTPREAFYPLHSCWISNAQAVINGVSLILNLIAWTRHFNLSALIFYLKCYTNGNKKHEEREVNM